jgi:hypothetical protein
MCLSELSICPFTDPAIFDRCGLDVNCLSYSSTSTIAVIQETQCSSYSSSMQAAILALSSRYCAITTNRSIWDDIIDNVPPAIAAAGGVGLLALLIQPPPTPLLTPQGIPSGNPLPGTPGGGAPPVASTLQAATAIGLALVGTVPVAIFPPYDSPRTVSAVSVIFAENPLVVVQTGLTRKVSKFASQGK